MELEVPTLSPDVLDDLVAMALGISLNVERKYHTNILAVQHVFLIVHIYAAMHNLY